MNRGKSKRVARRSRASKSTKSSLLGGPSWLMRIFPAMEIIQQTASIWDYRKLVMYHRYLQNRRNLALRDIRTRKKVVETPWGSHTSFPVGEAPWTEAKIKIFLGLNGFLLKVTSTQRGLLTTTSVNISTSLRWVNQNWETTHRWPLIRLVLSLT